MKFKELNKEVIANGFLKVSKVNIEVDTFEAGVFKGQRIKKTVEVLNRGNAVAVLIKEIDTNTFLFTNQFRFPTTLENTGWLLEIPAGGILANEDLEECAKREIEEELGYVISEPLQFIGKFYVSPGGSTEMISVFYAEVNSTEKTSDGGGLIAEKEDIQVVKIDVQRAKEKLGKEIIDAKSIIAVQWYFLNR
jgi:ADP-ribose pyrophosphatase